jgi:predicted glycosyltransferase
MKILIETHHPAHIHFFKNAIRIWRTRGDEVLLLGRDRDVMKELLQIYDWIPHEIVSEEASNNRFPFAEMIKRQLSVAKTIRSFNPDLVLSLMGSYTQSAYLFGIPNIIFTDSEFQNFNHKIAHPFATTIFTPECFTKPLGKKQIKYNGYHELAFLHPNYFSPDHEVFNFLDGAKERDYLILRLSAWNTMHDIGEQGFSRNLDDFVSSISDRLRLFIIPEGDSLPPHLEPFRLKVPPHLYHDALAFARLVVSEGASTASEAACLGVPAIFINSTRRSYLEDQEKHYGLVKNIHNPDLVLEQTLSLLENDPGSVWYQQQKNLLIAEHIDVTEFILNQIDQLRG